MGVIEFIFFFFNVVILLFFIYVNGTYLVLNTIAYFRIRKLLKYNPFISKEQPWKSPFSKPITLIVPAYNESRNIVTSLHSLLQIYYPNFEVILVNDGSTDDTLEKLREAFHLKISPRIPTGNIKTQKIRRIFYSGDYDNLFVIDKENGGKADAINAGINFARFPLVCVIDADSILERDAFVKMVRPFVEYPETIAVGGIVRIVNSSKIVNGEVLEPRLSKNHWVRFQSVEYLRAFLFGRVGWDNLKSLLIISGAFGLYRRDALLEVGGYDTTTIGEDMELTVRLHKHFKRKRKKYRITFVPEPVCWTEVPEDYHSLKSQRNRWQRGLMQSLLRHKDMFLNPRYGFLGIFAFPFYFLAEMLSPVIEFGGILFVIFSFLVGIINLPFFVFFLFAAIVLAVLLSVSSITLEEFAYHRYTRYRDLLILLGYALLENFGYRQLHSYFRLTGIRDYFKGRKEWGKLERRGFKDERNEAGEKTDEK
ncbi:MAG: glycosyltransferase [Calditrichia bacterium]